MSSKRLLWGVVLGFVSVGASAVVAGEKKTLFIGIDGLRSDALITADTPYLDSLISGAWGGGAYNTAYGYNAQIFPETNWTPISENGHSAMDTGTSPAVNGGVSGVNWASYPNYMTILKNNTPSLNTAYLMTWNWANALDTVNASYVGCPVRDGDAVGGASVAAGDQAITNRMVGIVNGTFSSSDSYALRGTWTAGADPDALYMFYDSVDSALHTQPGALPSNANYISTIEQTDARIGQVLTAIASRATFADEDWQIVVTSDHGGRGASHSIHTPATDTVPLIVTSKDVQQGQITGTPRIMDVAATVLDHMQVAVPAYMSGSSIVQGQSVLAQPADIKTGLVAYLRFENDLTDSSGRGHDAANGANSDYAPALSASGGKFGGYVHIDDHGGGTSGSSYLTLGTPADLNLGAATNATIALWFKPSAGLDGTPVIIGNNNWSSTTSPGVAVLANQAPSPDGKPAVFLGPSLHASDGTRTSDAGSVPYRGAYGEDGWWFIAATLDRGGNATLHVGSPSGVFWLMAYPDSSLTDLSSLLPWNIGQDGTGNYAHNLAGDIDDLSIWSRQLTLNELLALYNDGAGVELSSIPEPATMSLLSLGGLAALIRRRGGA